MDINKPIMWTSKGNLQLDELTVKPQWQDSPDSTVFIEEWVWNKTGEVVVRHVHVMSKQSVTGEAVAAALPG